MRIKIQQYPDIPAIIASNDTNEGNDLIMSEADGALFWNEEASTATPDQTYIIQQTQTTGAGRFRRFVLGKGFYTGTATSSVIPNGNSITVNVPVTGALVGKMSNVNITNAEALNTAGLEILSERVISNGIVRVTLFNPTGSEIAAQTVNVEVLQY